jgi:prophage tail gpP-like protein
MTTLAPRASVTLGNERFDTHVFRLEVTLTMLPGVSAFQAFFPSEVAIEAAAGDDAALDLDGGEGSERVLTGTIRSIRRGVAQTVVTVADPSAVLASLRPATTYRNQDANAVIRALASDAEVTVATSEVELPMAAYVAHQRRTAAEHIADLAALLGAYGRMNGDGELEVSRPSAADVALRYGRELLTYDASESVAPTAKRIRTGSGPAGSATAPDALRPAKKPLPGGAAEPGVDAIWTPAAVLRTPGAAASASEAADVAAAAGVTRLRATAYLVPSLRPGSVVEVQELPDGLPAVPWLLTRVMHVIDVREGGRTRFVAESASDSGAGLGGLP